MPVRINNLGFRDRQDYDLAKPPGTFRILVLGDSVTFGHGSHFETTYPYLLEQRLKEWRPATNWQVWNLGVPGYNTRQELRYLQEVGATFRPDLVIVGFYPNDFDGNETVPTPTATRRLSSGVQRLMQRHLYSYEFYKRVFLTLRWKLLTSEDDRRRLEHLATEGALLASETGQADRPEQRLTDVEYIDDESVRTLRVHHDAEGRYGESRVSSAAASWRGRPTSSPGSTRLRICVSTPGPPAIHCSSS